MARYKVTIVAPGDGQSPPVLVVPFEPNALVTAFIDELYKRIARNGLALKPDTHIATLHLDSETGAVLDCEDVLSDVIGEDERDKLFMVLKHRNEAPVAPEPVQVQVQVQTDTQVPEGHMRVLVVTTARAVNAQTDPVAHSITTSKRASLRQLHQQVATHLGFNGSQDDLDLNECNCTLASKLADDPTQPGRVLLVHGKSEVQLIHLVASTEGAIRQAAASALLNSNLDTEKRVALVGGQRDTANPTIFNKPPIVAVCSKQRHVPIHARLDDGEESSPDAREKILDLHSTESPIHPACFDATIESGLGHLAQDGTVTLFAVTRNKSNAKSAPATGKNSIFRSKSHWQPPIKQSDRGINMFLSSLRVFVSLVQDMKNDEKAQDAVLHVFDLLTNFQPAVRALYILLQGKTPTAVECAALAHATFDLLGTFIPTSLLGTNQTRLFEGSRLLFGFILESAKGVKLPSNETHTPYMASFETADVRDYISLEPVLSPVATDNGIMERSLHAALQEGGLLAASHLRDLSTQSDEVTPQSRLALLSGGQTGEVVGFSKSTAYTYSDNGNVGSALDLEELTDLEHLAELCGRNKLAVHRPSQLTSSITPCLTFDRNALLAVYVGEQPCGAPGRSSLLFRPQHGEATVDTAVIEQLIAPIIRTYEADGTAVLDALGGAAVRRLQQPDEALMFVVDCSASMRRATDFDGVNDFDDPPSAESQARAFVGGAYYNALSLDDLKKRVCAYEGFADMIGIVADASDGQSTVVGKVVELLRIMLSSEIVQKNEALEKMRSYAFMSYGTRASLTARESELARIKEFWAGLKTHETAIGDFLQYRANNDSRDVSKTWYWSLSDPVPAMSSAQHIPRLADDITDLPDDLRCPISHSLMGDAVKSADGFTYARPALEQWYTIRKSSPMTGLPIEDTSMQSNDEISEAAAAWERGDDIYANAGAASERGDGQPDRKRQRSSDSLEVVFDSRFGSFTRKLLPSMSLRTVYKLVFRALKAKHAAFQLSSDQYGTFSAAATILVATTGIQNGQHITVRIADDEPQAPIAPLGPPRQTDSCLVKVYLSQDTMAFGFWTDKHKTSQTMATILWKYWRWTFSRSSYAYPSDMQVWTDLKSSGDGLLEGSPRALTERLSNFLTREHCFGSLVQEKLYREPGQYNYGQGPLVLKVDVSPRHHAADDRGKLTRLNVLTQMFEATINRMIAYNYKTHVGLVAVESKPAVKLAVTHVLENLRQATNAMVAHGDTSLWDGLALARDQLVEYGKKFPSAKKRIVVISDGEDTTSTTNTAQDICWLLRESGIVVDTVALGDEDNEDLRAISYMLGGYILQPKSLVNALAMCEMEPFLSLVDRPDITPADAPRARIPFMSYFWNARRRSRPTKCDEDVVPPIKKHPRLDDDFIELAAMASRPVAAPTASSYRGRLRSTRLMTEMKAIVANQGNRKYDVYVSESDFSFWKIVMDGPDGSPYAGGTFMLYMHAEDNYPSSAPKARFMTKIRHPNVNPNGRICHSIFDRDWTSDTSMATLLDIVYGLLLQPEHSDPVNVITTLGYHADEVEFAEEVREHVSKHAKRTRAEWKAILMGEVAEDEEEEPDAGEEEDDEDMDGLDGENFDGYGSEYDDSGSE